MRFLGCIALLAVLAAGLGARAQEANSFEIREVERIHLDDVYPGPEGERVVELYLRALTRYGEPVEELHKKDLVIRDAGELIEVDDLMAEGPLLQSLAASGRGMACIIGIDTSRTMKGEPFRRAREAALDFLELLEGRDRVAIVAISDEVTVVAPFTASKAQAKVELEGLEVDSESLSTALYDGIHKSVELIRLGENLPRRAFVILFSDGKDSGSHRTLEEVIESSRGTELRPPVLIFTIGYARFGGEGLAVLKKLSKETGGDFLRAESTIHLATFFNEIWRQMKRSYVVRYPGRMDGRPHTVEVSVEGHSAVRTVDYPSIRGPIWPYLAVGLLVALVAGAGLLVTRGRPAGRLEFVGGPLAGEVVALKRPKTRIGALPDNDIVIPADTISRYHAAIHVKRGRAEIEDLNSRNGTFVNGNPVRSIGLQPGDKITLADIDLVYQR